MLTVNLARQLRDDGGLLWSPKAGDRFVIDAELLTGDVFWISDLTVETQSSATRLCSASTGPPSGPSIR